MEEEEEEEERRRRMSRRRRDIGRRRKEGSKGGEQDPMANAVTLVPPEIKHQGRTKHLRREGSIGGREGGSEADKFLQIDTNYVASPGTKIVHKQHPRVHNFAGEGFGAKFCDLRMKLWLLLDLK
ncbi:hypothetical protein PoB_004692200 [Plakobranchus ocellatus]|uniref:Uncharacterized protein n=1 Tax=Plakobranchus ocellatus TaxID=259542 RepID=A0AAV4BNA9_9GAST|nr:hypothetical protein PoB_004692200 [Plakobranchus ocellatus]